MWEMMGYNVTYRLSTIALILCRGVPVAVGPFAVFRGSSPARCVQYLRSPYLSEVTPLPLQVVIKNSGISSLRQAMRCKYQYSLDLTFNCVSGKGLENGTAAIKPPKTPEV